MSFSYGERFRVTLFGQSHAPSVGVVIDGLPAGIPFDMDAALAFMARRAPGGALATARQEADVPEILSGLVNGHTCGAPIAAVIRNTDARSGDYAGFLDTPRPSHADYAAFLKHGAFHDVRGGGYFSARLTAPLCFAGAIAIQALAARGIALGAHLYSVAQVQDTPFDPVTVSSIDFARVRAHALPVNDETILPAIQQVIEDARATQDSVGGIVECAATNLPGGLGDPPFDGVENRLCRVLFAIPALRGVEFGAGFAAAAMRGSAHNDPFLYENGVVKTHTNHHGGALGGLTSGMPLLFRAAFKPTPSIGMEQDTVNLATGENVRLSIMGRHDPCVALRAVPCVEAAAAVALLDMML
ncbi:MAG: chorismate synthase [Clostridia bacterium]|nr:chorismate synthase [Clostridia bacterium]